MGGGLKVLDVRGMKRVGGKCLLTSSFFHKFYLFWQKQNGNRIATMALKRPTALKKVNYGRRCTEEEC